MRPFFLLMPLCVILLLNACTDDAKQPLPLTDEQLARIMGELAIADAATMGTVGYAKDTLALHYYEQVFDMHRVKREEYIQAVYLLSEDLPRMRSVMERADSMLRQQYGNLRAAPVQ